MADKTQKLDRKSDPKTNTEGPSMLAGIGIDYAIYDNEATYASPDSASAEITTRVRNLRTRLSMELNM